MTNHISKVTAAAVLASVAGLSACGGAFAEGSSGGGGGSYSGAITFTNNTSEGVCGVEFYRVAEQFDSMLEDFRSSPIAAGESRAFDVSFSPNGVRVLACDSDETLWDSYMPRGIGGRQTVSLSGGSIILTDSGSQVTDGSELTLVVERRPFSAWIPTAGALHSQFEDSITDTMENVYRSRQMTSTLLNATVVSDDFEIERDTYGNVLSRKFRVLTLMRHPSSGRCMAQEFGLKQQFEGSDFSERVQFDGPGLLLAIPCRAVE